MQFSSMVGRKRKKAGPENLPPGDEGREPRWARQVVAFYAIGTDIYLYNSLCPDFGTRCA